MPQEFYVLKCFSCETFQVHIVKKARKWECKMCGAKQSLKRNYGKGSSKDCRNQVMKLNELRLSKDNSLKEMEDEILEETWTNDLTEQSLKEEPKEQKPIISKWAEYVEENVLDTESETDNTGENFLLDYVDKKKKRAKKMPESYSKSKKICMESSETEIFSKEFEKRAKACSTSNNEKSFACFNENRQNTGRKDFKFQFKNKSKPGKYAKYLQDEESNDLVQKAKKTSSIFESSLNDLDDILNF